MLTIACKHSQFTPWCAPWGECFSAM